MEWKDATETEEPETPDPISPMIGGATQIKLYLRGRTDPRDINSMPILLLNRIPRIPGSGRTIQHVRFQDNLRRRGIDPGHIEGLNGEFVYEYLSHPRVTNQFIQYQYISPIPPISYTHIDDLLPQQVTFLCIFHHLLFCAKESNPRLGGAFTDSFEDKFTNLQALLNALPPTRPGGRIFNRTVDEYNDYLRTLQSRMRFHDPITQYKFIEEIVEMIKTGPDAIWAWYEEGMNPDTTTMLTGPPCVSGPTGKKRRFRGRRKGLQRGPQRGLQKGLRKRVQKVQLPPINPPPINPPPIQPSSAAAAAAASSSSSGSATGPTTVSQTANPSQTQTGAQGQITGTSGQVNPHFQTTFNPTIVLQMPGRRTKSPSGVPKTPPVVTKPSGTPPVVTKPSGTPPVTPPPVTPPPNRPIVNPPIHPRIINQPIRPSQAPGSGLRPMDPIMFELQNPVDNAQAIYVGDDPTNPDNVIVQVNDPKRHQDAQLPPGARYIGRIGGRGTHGHRYSIPRNLVVPTRIRVIGGTRRLRTVRDRHTRKNRQTQ